MDIFSHELTNDGMTNMNRLWWIKNNGH